MKKKFQSLTVKVLSLFVLLQVCVAGVTWAAEGHPEFEMDPNGSFHKNRPIDTLVPGGADNYCTQFNFNYYNDDGYDSWSGGLEVWVDDTYIGTLSSFAYEDGDEDVKVGESISNEVDGCGTVTAKISAKYSSGDDYYITVQVFFGLVAYGKTHRVEARAKWWADHDYDKWYSKSYYTNSGWKYMTMSGSVRSVGKNKVEYSNVSTPYDYKQYMAFYKEKKWPNWEKPNSSNCIFTDMVAETGNTRFTVNFDVESNYKPQKVYPIYWVERENSIFHDYLSDLTLPHFFRPGDISVNYDQWTRNVTLAWSKQSYDSSAINDGRWMISRKKKGDSKLTFLGATDFNTCSFTDKNVSGLEYDSEYTYYVSFVPSTWGGITAAKMEELYAEDLSASKNVTMNRMFSIELKAEGKDDFIDLAWDAPKIQSNGSYKYTVFRCKGDGAFESIKNISVTDINQTHYEYKDASIPDARASYTYYVEIDKLMQRAFRSDETVASVSGFSRAVNVYSSKGTYDNSVNIHWTAKQYGSTTTYYTLYRRVLNSESEWDEVYSTSGTAQNYSYNDRTLVNGVFYEYKVYSYSIDSETNEKYGESELKDNGFCSLTGTISGNITYDSGTAVAGVKVNLEVVNDENQGSVSQFYALNVLGNQGGIKWDISDKNAKRLLQGKPWTLQLYINPEAVNSNPEIFETDGLVLSLKQQDYKYALYANGNKVDGILIPSGEYTNLTVSYDGGSGISATCIDRDMNVSEGRVTCSYGGFGGDSTTVFVGGSRSIVPEEGFVGHIDDVRFFAGRVLTLSDIKSLYDHTLNGNEQGLIAYWPMDEGVAYQNDAYDYSMTNSSPNENHAKIQANHIMDGYVPLDSQLGLYAVTDETGNYIIRGIHYTGAGTNYIVRPQLGIHEFSPNTMTRFISANSNVYSGSSFTDVSSFPVSGVVYYEGTNYPVEDCEVCVDGSVAGKEGSIIKTDKDGRFTVDVPIGDHYVSVKKAGHTFVVGGRYPESGKHNFNAAVDNLTFFDDTKVVVAGRIDGGMIEYDKPLGFGESVNNIGVAKVVLKSDYLINAKQVADGTVVRFEPADEQVEYGKATDKVNSKAVAGAGSVDAAKTVTITTDPMTGEFAAVLPPMYYRIASVSVESNPDISFGDYAEAIDVSDVMKEETDSCQNKNGVYEKFTYNGKLKLAYRSKPVFEIEDPNASEGAFGERQYVYFKEDGTTELYDLYTVGENGSINYTYNYPIFYKMDSYTLKMSGYEYYENKDEFAAVPSQKVPLQNVGVTVNNQFSIANKFMQEDGSLLPVEDERIELDSLGKATYVFQVGAPSLTGDFSRVLTIKYEINGTDYIWKCPDSADGNFRGIVFGEIPMGSTFLTAGPDYVSMIIRDPAGSASYASWTESTTTSTTYTHKFSNGIKDGFKTSTSFGLEEAVAEGIPGCMVIIPASTKADVDNTFTSTELWNFSDGWVHKTTSKVAVSTSADKSFDGPDADVFIGTSTNQIIGRARDVGLHMRDGGMKLDVDEIFVMGTKFNTDFNFTQHQIQDQVIPDYIAQRNSLIKPKGTEVRNFTDYFMYVSLVDADDPNFGSDGYYKLIEPEVTNKDCVYEDSVLWCNEQVRRWKEVLAQNERAKVTAIEDPSKYLLKNYSFDAGSTVSVTKEQSRSGSEGDGFSYDLSDVVTGTFGFHFMGQGFKQSFSAGYARNYSTFTDVTNDTVVSFAYTLAEKGTIDALTVDVFDAPDHFGPIFVTRAGQTSGNWEPQRVTQYYKPGTEIMARTLKVRVPKLEADNPVVTNVPVGKEALFNLTVANNSETGNAGYYRLELDGGSNPHGAAVTEDGTPLNNGVTNFIKYNEPIKITLALRQTDLDILDYRVAVVLLDVDQDTENKLFKANTDTLWLEAHFVPASCDIDISTTTPVLNMYSNGTAEVKLSGYDLNRKNLMHIALQHKGEHDIAWTTDSVWSTNDGDTSSERKLTDFSVTSHIDMSNPTRFPDQKYLFRGVTVSNFGGQNVENYSEEIAVVKDMSKPELIEDVSPANGVYSLNSEVSLTFNQDILGGLLKKNEDVTLTGLLNNAILDHNTSLRCDAESGANSVFETTDISAGPTTCTMWLKWQKPGRIISVSDGDDSKKDKYQLYVNDDGIISIVICNNIFLSRKPLPKDEWVFLSIVSDISQTEKTLTVDYATDAKTVCLIDHVPVDNISDVYGQLTVGRGFSGFIHDLVFWDYARPFEVSVSEKSKSKNKYTSHVISYWPFDEGHGIVARDEIYGFNLETTSSSAWHIESENYSLRLDGDKQARINLSDCATDNDQSYLMQMWFCADRQQDGNTDIFSMNDGKMRLKLNGADGSLSMINNGIETAVSGNDYRDGAWHNFSIIVRKSTKANSTVYIDGKNMALFSAVKTSDVMGMMLLGGGFKGYVDEVRIGKGDFSAETIAGNMYSSLNSEVVDIDAYYPFETMELDQFNQPVYRFDLANHAKDKTGVVTETNDRTLSGSKEEVAPLKPAPVLKNVDFDLVTSERKVKLNITEPIENIQGCMLYATVRNVQDEAGNVSVPKTWAFLVDRNDICWTTDDIDYSFCAEDMGYSDEYLNLQIENNTAENQEWTLVGLPRWLSVATQSGVLAPKEKYSLDIKIEDFIRNGLHQGSLYLIDGNGISRPLHYRITCLANYPDWEVNSSEYSNTMNIIGQVMLGGEKHDNGNSIVVAMDPEGRIVGMASPKYEQRYDACYVMMTVYGETASKEPLKFAFYDANSGTIHPSVDTQEEVYFVPNTLIGSMEEPLIWRPNGNIEQKMGSEEVWSWKSFNLIPEDTSIGAVFGNTAVLAAEGQTDCRGYVDEIVNEDRFAMFDTKLMKWVGELDSIETGTMYKIHGTQKGWNITLVGEPAQDMLQKITVNPKWNWLGANLCERLSIQTAFMSMNFHEGDIVKNKHSFATYTNGGWVGELTAIEPTEGYFYMLNSRNSQTLIYPPRGSVLVENNKDLILRKNGEKKTMEPESTYDYSDYTETMTMTAAVEMNGKRIGNFRLAAYDDNGVVRGFKKSHDEDSGHLIYMVVHGDGLATIRFKVLMGDPDSPEEVECEENIPFTDGQSMGTAANPFIFHIESTGIRGLKNGKANGRSVDLSGKTVNGMTVNNVYVTDGVKNIVK